MNGELVCEQDAVVSALDHGFLTGDGVFESVLVHRGAPFALRRHLDRLERSASIIGLDLPPRAEIEKAVGLVVRAAGCSRAKVRITVTGGPGPLSSARGEAGPTLVVAIVELDELKAATGTSVNLVPWPRNERGALAGSKTISYAENVVALAHARARGADEAIFANLAENLCEGTGSNVFVVLGGRLLTPPLSSGCLAGVTRSLVLELVPSTEERDIPVSCLDLVEEAFLTSTTRGVQPVDTMAGRRLASCPGPMSLAAGAAYEELLEKDADP